MDTLVDLAHSGVAADGTQGIHDDLALRRQTVTLFTYLFVIANLVMGHGTKFPYCEFLQLQINYNKDQLLWQQILAAG
jgi:hypothetical protein